MSSDKTPVIIFDLDGTITRYDTYVRFLLYVLRRRPHKAARLPGLAVDVLSHKLGFNDNTWLKKRFLRGLLSGHDRDTINRWASHFSQQVMEKGVRADALEKIRQHREEGHLTILLSASLDIYVEPLGALLGFDHVICTRTVWTDEVLGHQLDGGNCYGRAKIDRVAAYLQELEDASPLVAYADHESDLPLLKIAHKGYVVNPDDSFKEKAENHNLATLFWN